MTPLLHVCLVMPFICGSAVDLRAESVGTGLVVSTSGYVVTAFHAIEHATAIEILTAGGQRFADIAVVTKDVVNDLALLQIRDAEFTETAPRTPPFIVAAATPRIGQACLVVGYSRVSAIGAAPQVSACIVSDMSGADHDPRVLRVSRAMPSDIDGGAVLNDEGELIAVVMSESTAPKPLANAECASPRTTAGIRPGYLRTLLESLGDLSLSAARARTKSDATDRQIDALIPFMVRIVTRGAHVQASPHAASIVFKVKRWNGGLGELAVSSEGLRYREVNEPINDFTASCRDIKGLRLRDGFGWRPMLDLELGHRYGERFESRVPKDRGRQRVDVVRIREAIADACGILIRE